MVSGVWKWTFTSVCLLHIERIYFRQLGEEIWEETHALRTTTVSTVHGLCVLWKMNNICSPMFFSGYICVCVC